MNFADAAVLMSDAPRRPIITRNWSGKSAPVPDVVFVDVTEPIAAPPLKPAHKLVVAEKFEPGPLEICLGHWASWMRQDDKDLGVKNQGVITTGADDGEHEGYDDSGALADVAAARFEREIGMATNAMIESLPRHFKAAIYRRCNISSVWHFPNLDFCQALPRAESELIEKLRKNVATRAFW